MSQTSRVSRLASFLHSLTIIAMFALPIAIIVAFLAVPLSPENLAGTSDGVRVAPTATNTQLWGAAALNLVSGVILLLTLDTMRKLFDAYRKGDVLVASNARLIQQIGQGFLALSVAPLIVRPLQTLLLTMANPAGQRSISIGVDSNMMFFALCGGLMIVIGWAMREASAAAVENRSFV